MRTLRWAAERAVSSHDRESRLGIAALDSLGGSPWLEKEDQDVIDAVVTSLTTPAVEAYRERGQQEVFQRPYKEQLADTPTTAANTEGESG